MISHCSPMNLRTFKMNAMNPFRCVSVEASSPSLGARGRASAWAPRLAGSGSPLVTTIKGEALVVAVVLSQHHRRREEIGVGLCS